MGSIEYFNRSTGLPEEEKVYGEQWLRFTYENPIGAFFLWSVVRRKLFSMWYGFSANLARSQKKIIPFIRRYQIDESEFLHKTETFKNFNEFFSRKLKPSARPISSSKHSVIFPADGRHLGFQNLSKLKSIYVKGQNLDLAELFGSCKESKAYEDGTLVISRLCPVDYHRFHFPCDGSLSLPSLINGPLFSVNPIALRKRISIFWENKRYLSFVESKIHGRIAQFAIGATCVGSVTYTTKNSRVRKGEEYGFFSFGGSCILTIFEKGKVRLSQDLIECSEKGMELYAKMGEEMGRSQKFI